MTTKRTLRAAIEALAAKWEDGCGLDGCLCLEADTKKECAAALRSALKADDERAARAKAEGR